MSNGNFTILENASIPELIGELEKKLDAEYGKYKVLFNGLEWKIQVLEMERINASSDAN